MKLTLIALLVVLVAALASCTDNNSGVINIDYEKIHTGTEGLVLSTVSGAPPPEVLTEQDFSMVVKLENQGATNIKGGKLKLIMNQDYLDPHGVVSADFDLEGKSLVNPVGGVDFVTFLMTSKVLKETMSTYHDSELILLACYAYSSSMRKEVCVDTDLFNLNAENKEKVCQQSAFDPGTQGGPVVIYKVEPKYTGKDKEIYPQYVIYVKNAGRGQIIDNTKVETACGTATTGEDFWNIVKVSAKLGNQTLDCEPKLEGSTEAGIRLREGLDFFKCRATTFIPPGTPSYVGVLQVNVTYGYTESISRTVKIRRLL